MSWQCECSSVVPAAAPWFLKRVACATRESRLSSSQRTLHVPQHAGHMGLRQQGSGERVVGSLDDYFADAESFEGAGGSALPSALVPPQDPSR